MSLLGYVQHLSEIIGPRGSATQNESKAADYVAEQLAALNLQPERQTFLSARSVYLPYTFGAGAALLGVFFFWQPQPVGAAAAFVLTLTALVSILLEMSFKGNPLRWLAPVEYSQNIVAKISSGDASPRRPPILVTAHLDTSRTPLLFSSPSWLKVFRLLMPVGLACMAVLLALFAVGIFVEARSLRQIALLPGAIVLAMFVLLVQAEFTPFTKGANDNASGVAAGLELAGRLMQHPLQAHDILLVFTGCQEVGSYGADAFMSAHPVELRGAVHFVIDQLGGRAGSDGGPCIITGEKFLRTVYCDRRLLAVAERVASQHPELCAHTRFSTIAYSELSTGAKHGLRPLGVFGLDKDGALPNWHLRSDTLANINETTLERSADFVWLLLQAIDLEER